MKSAQAIHEFMETHNLDRDSFGNLHFSAIVEYRSPSRNLSEITNVKIIRNGYDDGKISLNETDELLAEEYHLDFTLHFQDYKFSKSDKKLTVMGDSPKMGGKYSISISPQ